MRQCPYCAELIQDEAILCHYCGRTISTGSEIQTSETFSKNGSILGNILIGVGSILGELYAIYIVALEWGLMGAIAAFLFFPVAIIVAPIYALVVYRAWFPLIIVYGFIGLGVIINATSNH